MDEFSSDYYFAAFEEYVKYNLQSNYDFTHENNSYIIQTDYVKGTISFFDDNIIELCIINKTNEELEFYIHFQIKNLKHAKDLYSEMLSVFNDYSAISTVKILLCCSSGLTTSFFASKLNEAAKVLQLPYTIEAVGYGRLYEIGNDYDIILLAPQVSYLTMEVTKIFKDKLVYEISPKIFGKYDCNAIFDFIKNVKQEKQKKLDKVSILAKNIKNKRNVLLISTYANDRRIHISYQVHQREKIVVDKKTIKQGISINDIYDVIDTQLYKYDIDIISISVPAMVYNGVLEYTFIPDIYDNDLYSALSKKYNQKILINNDVNSAAVGYYMANNESSILDFIFQPINGLAGNGLIIDGKLIKGRCNFAGELKFLPVNTDKHALDMSKSREGTLRLLSGIGRSIISIVGPDIIVIYSNLLVDDSVLRKELSRYIDSKYIPEIRVVDKLSDYIMLGLLAVANDEYIEKNNKIE